MLFPLLIHLGSGAQLKYCSGVGVGVPSGLNTPPEGVGVEVADPGIGAVVGVGVAVVPGGNVGVEVAPNGGVGVEVGSPATVGKGSEVGAPEHVAGFATAPEQLGPACEPVVCWSSSVA